MLMRNLYFLFLLFMNPSLLMAQLPAGAVAKYPLNNNSATDVSGNGYNGTLTATSATANRFGSSNSAIAFVAGTSTGSLPSGLVTALANDFSIGFWFKTTMNAPSSSQWYGGAALVDAEVCGGTSDFGTALINGGSVAMGIGNPDITIISPGTTYNDGAWHFVTAVRSEAAGVITLYIDGSQVATTSGTSTAARTAPPAIGLADNNCVATGVYTGSLDDIIAYGSALTSAQVTQLYNYSNTTSLPLDWLSFSARAAGSGVYLQWSTDHSVDNNFFDVERSTDGTNFSLIGQVSNLDSGGNAIGATAYNYTDANPPQGNVFYRIMEVDKDGQESWSSISEVTIGKGLTGIHLQNNPVTDQATVINNGQILLQRLQVLDVSGRVLIDQAPYSSNSVLQLGTSSLPSGYYLLRVSASGTHTTIPFVKL
jgi:Concanavalin A-like lectin/glucanases superfamily/Secretion system C-terminal sorting domain